MSQRMEAKAVPRHYIEESDTVRSVTLPSWEISTENHPISNATHLDELNGELGIPLPEMTFGHNMIRLKHKPSRWEYRFDTLHAIKPVKNGELQEGDGAVTVKQSEAWLKSRTDPNSQIPMPAIVPTKPYDWTYTTTYEGHATGQKFSFKRADPTNPAHAIPMAELQRHDPILFYGQTLLFEDELHDNGSSSLLIRVRVMPGCIFLLARFTLRVDHVLFRTFDTRLYHSFSSSPPLVIKEVIGLEARYDDVKRCLDDPEDLTPLTDATFIANTLSSFTPQQKQAGAGTGWRGIGRKVDVVILQEVDANGVAAELAQSLTLDK